MGTFSKIAFCCSGHFFLFFLLVKLHISTRFRKISKFYLFCCIWKLLQFVRKSDRVFGPSPACILIFWKVASPTKHGITFFPISFVFLTDLLMSSDIFCRIFHKPNWDGTMKTNLPSDKLHYENTYCIHRPISLLLPTAAEVIGNFLLCS